MGSCPGEYSERVGSHPGRAGRRRLCGGEGGGGEGNSASGSSSISFLRLCYLIAMMSVI